MIIKYLILVHNPPSWSEPAYSTILYPLIRLAAGTYWNHCALLVEISGQEMVMEATGKGVILSAREVWRRRSPSRRTRWIQCNHPGQLPLLDLLGLRYDVYSLVGWAALKTITGRWYGPMDERARERIYCYELAALAFGHPEPWGVLPKELEAHVLGLPMPA